MTLELLSKRRPRPRRERRSESGLAGWGVIALFLSIVLEGALRKWLLPPSWHILAYVSKDIIAIILIISFPLPRQAYRARRLRNFSLFLAMTTMLPLLFGVGRDPVSALSTYLNVWMWALLAAHLSASLTATAIRRLTTCVAIFTVAAALLGSVQFRSAATAPINKYAVGSGEFIATFGSAETGVRAAGTFSYIAGFSTYSIFAFGFLMWSALKARAISIRILTSTGVFAAVIIGITTGSRVTIAAMAATAVIFCITARRTQILFNVSLGTAALAAVLVLAFPSAVDQYVSRWLHAGDEVVDRITGNGVRASYSDLLSQYPAGIGLGQQSNVAALRDPRSLRVASYDHAISNAITEGGWFSVVAILATLAFAVLLGTELFMHRSPSRRLSVAAMGCTALYAIVNCLWGDHVGTAIHWLGIAICLSKPAGSVLGVELQSLDLSKKRRFNVRYAADTKF